MEDYDTVYHIDLDLPQAGSNRQLVPDSASEVDIECLVDLR